MNVQKQNHPYGSFALIQFVIIFHGKKRTQLLSVFNSWMILISSKLDYSVDSLEELNASYECNTWRAPYKSTSNMQIITCVINLEVLLYLIPKSDDWVHGVVVGGGAINHFSFLT